MNKKQWKLSASAISCFKSCPMRFFYKYVCGLEPVEATESQRIGSNWHRIQEINGMEPGSVCPECSKTQKNSDCPLCGGTDILPADMMDAVIHHLNQAYADRPMSKTPEEWETERIILLYSLVGYNWYYSDQKADDEIIAQEMSFRIPLLSCTSNRALPNVVVDGRIDKIIRRAKKLLIQELKSTGSSLDSDSSYWNHLNLDTQTTLYPYAVRSEYENIGVLLDAWHKPTIRPKKLTQADSKKFVETGEYMGEKFEIKRTMNNEFLEVNNTIAECEPGKKEGTFAIRETPEMFGARLLVDITERPEFYFVQKQIPRTESDYERFQIQLFNIYQTIRLMYKNNGWYTDESQCEATFRCPYTNFCYNNMVIVPGDAPEGFKKASWVGENGDKS